MPRIELSEDGRAFLDVLITDNKGYLGIVLTFKVPAAHFRSGLVLREEIPFGWNVSKMRGFIEGLFASTDKRRTLDRQLRFNFKREDGSNRMTILRVEWEDSAGRISFECLLTEGAVEHFKKTIEATLSSVVARTNNKA